MTNNSGQQTQSELDKTEQGPTPVYDPAATSQASNETTVNAVAPTDLETRQDPDLNTSGEETFSNDENANPPDMPPASI